ncbi:MAG: glutamate 5-kinase [Myxococcota bacterium]
MSPRAELSARARRGRIVVKIGSGVLTDARGGLDARTVKRLAGDIAPLASPRRWPFVVSSGAIAVGTTELGLSARPRTMPGLQAAAAVGQSKLVEAWSAAMRRFELKVAQVLLTHADVEDRGRFLNAKNALLELHRRKAIAVINENDTVSTEEIAFGDNDQLAAEVANLVDADLLVLMSVAPGILDGNGQRIPIAAADDPALDGLIMPQKSKTGVGGMASKLKSARAATRRGAMVAIIDGRRPSALPELLSGEDIGTLLLPEEGDLKQRSREHWIAHSLRPKGRLIVDAGAAKALVRQKRSLLPKGIVAVEGSFEIGESVEVLGPDRAVLARGLARYGQSELSRIRGLASSEIQGALGLSRGDEAIHRDDLVVLVPGEAKP